MVALGVSGSSAACYQPARLESARDLPAKLVHQSRACELTQNVNRATESPDVNHLECPRSRRISCRRNSDRRLPKAGLAATASDFIFGAVAAAAVSGLISLRTGPV